MSRPLSHPVRPCRVWLARLFQCWLVWLLLVPMLASARDHITERAWQEDPSNALTLEQVRQRPFTPYEGLLSRGYGNSAIWIRLRIDPATNPPSSLTDQLVLRLRLSYMDEVQLFDPLLPSESSITRPSFSYRSLNRNFVLPRGEAPRDIYLRLQSQGTRTKAIEVLTLEETLEHDRVQEAVYATYLAVLLVFLFWALLHWLSSRDRVIGIFAFKQTLAFFWSLSLLGYVRWLLGEDAPRFVALMVVAFTAASAYFDYCLFREYQPPRWALRVLLALIALLPLEVALIYSGHISIALRINMTATLLIVCWSFVISLLVRPRQGPSAPPVPPWGLVVFYGVIALSIMVTTLMLLGVFHSVEMALHALQVHGLVTGVIMVLFLQVRAQRLAQRQAQVLTELAVAQENAKQAQVHRLEQDKLLEEIRQLAFHDSLTQLPNRRLLREHLQQALHHNKRGRHHSALLFMDLDKFKPLNDAHGHHVGDLLLLEVAQRLRGCARASDTVSRFGGDEFVVLLNDFDFDEATAQQQVQVMAGKILDSLGQPYRLQDDSKAEATLVTHHCSASIGVRLFSVTENSIDELLDQADAAMYAAKVAGRGTVRFHASAAGGGAAPANSSSNAPHLSRPGG